jgi:hypothetical protein
LIAAFCNDFLALALLWISSNPPIMGVHGLTTYLRENKRGLTSTVAFNAPATEPDVPVVVDGWS